MICLNWACLLRQFCCFCCSFRTTLQTLSSCHQENKRHYYIHVQCLPRCLGFLIDDCLPSHVSVPLCRIFLLFYVTLTNLLKVIYLASDFVVILCISTTSFRNVSIILFVAWYSVSKSELHSSCWSPSFHLIAIETQFIHYVYASLVYHPHDNITLFWVIMYRLPIWTVCFIYSAE